jgi:hypothetical protein
MPNTARGSLTSNTANSIRNRKKIQRAKQQAELYKILAKLAARNKLKTPYK